MIFLIFMFFIQVFLFESGNFITFYFFHKMYFWLKNKA